MKINLPQRPNPNDVANPSFLAQHTSTVVQALSRNISFTDNMQGAVMTVALAHGVPTLVANPLPQVATPLGVLDCQADTQLKPNVTVSKTAIVNGILTTAPTGKLFLTALYPLPEQFVQIGPPSVAQSIPSAAYTALSLASTPSKIIGAHLTYNGSNAVTATYPGLYDARFQFLLNNATVASISQGAIGKNGSSVRTGWTAVTQPAGSPVVLSGSVILPCVAGDIIQAFAFQNSGAAILSDTATTYLEMRQLSNDASLTANVTLFLAGA